MLTQFFTGYNNYLIFIGLILAFLLTCILLQLLKNILPRDGGRAFAVNGALSQGKPRGAGIVFILIFIFLALLFVPVSRELIIYDIMLAAAMISGYLDDSSSHPWNEYKKAIIDFVISLVTALTYVNFNGTSLHILILDRTIQLPVVLFVLLAVILIWTAINVVNCTDGVDGLCGSISIITLLSFYALFVITGGGEILKPLLLLMIACLLGYLWFNASPSRLLMGDAGSRALGLFIAVTALKSGSALLFLPFALVFILDGGLGLIKVSLLRFLKIKIMTGIRTPLHDHVRKNKGWSDTQTVFRFMILQIMISCIIFFFIYLQM